MLEGRKWDSDPELIQFGREPPTFSEFMEKGGNRSSVAEQHVPPSRKEDTNLFVHYYITIYL